MRSTHINLVLAAEVASGRQAPTTLVGTGIDDQGKFYNAYIRFDKGGAPVISPKTGAHAFNFRPQ